VTAPMNFSIAPEGVDHDELRTAWLRREHPELWDEFDPDMERDADDDWSKFTDEGPEDEE